jgi:oligosaccharide repeat unit polymerase
MHSYWWFKPHIVTGVWAVPLLLIATAMPDEWYREIGGAPKFLNFEIFAVGLFGLLFFIGGAWLSARPFSRFEPIHANSFGLSVRETTYRQTMYMVMLVTSVAYVIWLWKYLVNPSLIVAILRGDPGAVYAARQIAERVPGVTSFANVAPLCVLLFALYSKVTGARLKKWDKLAMGLFLFVTVLRTFIYSERLALVLVAVPFVLVAFGGAAKRWKAIGLLPVVLAVLLVLLFGINEYFRSWLNFYVDRWDSFGGFVLSRLAAYYMTALNNGALMFEKIDPLYVPFYTAGWFWKFPIELVPGGMPELLSADMDVYWRLLESYARPEFNNNSGLFAPFIDFGIVGGMIFWPVLGWVSGRLYHGFTKGTAVGLFLYPCWYTGVLEIPRLFTFGGQQYFVLFFVTLGVICIFTRRNRQ